MRALVLTCHDPFRPANHRTSALVRRRRSLRNLAPKTACPVICQVNGQWITRQAWARRINDGDTVLFITLPRGGGGGSNPLKIILSLALMVFAPEIGAWANAELFAAESSLAFALSNSALGSVIGFVGNMLVSALMPPPKPTMAQQAGSLAAASPTYSMGAQGNVARIGQPIPSIYGRMLVYPDFAAVPYVEYAGNEQYLYQLFCIGHGEYDIEALRIEDTPLSSFPEITYQVVQPGGAVTLFPAAVATSTEVAGQEALSGAPLGPFVANASGSLTDRLAVDVIASRGLYYANDAGGLDAQTLAWRVEVQRIDDVGAAIGGWTLLANESYTAATTTPQRLSYSYAVAAGRYQVRLTRTDSKNTDARYAHELDWAGLRAYLPGSQSYGQVTMLAMRLRASNSLSAQASHKINAIVTRKLYTWSPATGWSATRTPTRSIAWALADIAQARYGAQLEPSRIALDELAALDTTWAARGDNFDFVFDSQSTVMESLTIAARAGRAVPYIQGGIVHCARDQAATIPVALFSQRNILKNSLSLDYIMASEETADAVDVTYWDADIWGERTVRATLPGGTADKPAAITLPGVTTRKQAWNEGMHTAACNRYRRRVVTFSTEMEGFIPTIFDLIAVQHDMPRWGQSGEIVAWDSATKAAVLSEPLDWSGGGAHVLALRDRAGKPHGPFTCVAGGDAYHVTLGNWIGGIDPVPDTGGDRERSHYAFGPSNQQYIRCRVLSVKPKSPETAEIVAIVESDYVHTADTGTAPTAAAWALSGAPTAPEIVGLSARYVPGSQDKMVLSWQPAAGADHYLVEQSNNDGTWTRIGEPTTSSFTAVALYGVHTVIRVAAVGLVRGPWVIAAVADTGSYVHPAAVAGLTLSYDSGVINISWALNAETNISYYEARLGATWDTGVRIGRGLTSIQYPINAPGLYKIWLAAISTPFGLESPAVTASITIAVPAMLTGITVTPGILNGYFQCAIPPEADWAGIQICVGTSPSFTPSPGNMVYDGPSTTVVVTTDGVGAALVAGGTYYIKAAAYSSVIKTGLIWSAGYIFSPVAAGGIPVVSTVGALPAGKPDGTVYSVTSDHKLYRYNATLTQWGTWADGSDLLASSVTAGKISVANLGAISANLGAITAGNITLDAAGFIRGGQTAYHTGTGFWMGYSGGYYKWSIGNPAGSYMAWSGTDLYVQSPYLRINPTEGAVFSGSLSAAVGTFSGAVNVGAYTGYSWPAAGNYGAHLSSTGLLIGNANNGKYFQVTSAGNIYAPGFYVADGVLTIWQANVINTLNIAGEAVTVPRSARGATNATIPATDYGTSIVALMASGYGVIQDGGGQIGYSIAFALQVSVNGGAWATISGDNFYSSGGGERGSSITENYQCYAGNNYSFRFILGNTQYGTGRVGLVAIGCRR